MDPDVNSLIETVEESFGVKFNRNEVNDETHIEDLCRLMASQLTPASPGVCFSSIAFWRLRKALMNVFGLTRSSITPSASTELFATSGEEAACVASIERGFRSSASQPRVPRSPERTDTDYFGSPFNCYRHDWWRRLVARGGGRSHAVLREFILLPLATIRGHTARAVSYTRRLGESGCRPQLWQARAKVRPIQ